MPTKYTRTELMGLTFEISLLRFWKFKDCPSQLLNHDRSNDEDLFASWWEGTRDVAAVVYRTDRRVELFYQGVSQGVRKADSENFWAFVELMVSSKERGLN